MKIIINIFLIIDIIVKAQSFSTGNHITKIKYQPDQYYGLYDFYRAEIENLQNNYKTALKVDVKKRTSNGKYFPLYDEFKKRLDSFNAALLLDSDKQPTDNKSYFRRFGASLNSSISTSNNLGDATRSNHGFLNYFGFNKKSKDDMENFKRIEQSKQYKTPKKSKLNKSFKTSNKAKFVVKPGNLYDEYERQIKKASDIFAKDMSLQRN